MKPRVSYADLRWLQSFTLLKNLPRGTKLYASDMEFMLDFAWDDPHPQRMELKYRKEKKQRTYHVRRGDPLIFDLTCAR